MENGKRKVENEWERVPEVVYHKVDLGPMPVIDYEEDTGGDEDRRKRTSLDRSPKGTKIIAQGKAAGRHPGSGGHEESLPEGEQQKTLSTTPSPQRCHPSYPGGELKASTTPSSETDATTPNQGGELRAGETSVRSSVEGVSLFRTRVVTEMLDEVTDKPRAMPLLDDLWLTGEMAVCFGESGVGKSILAVQIADAIARGRNECFTAERQRRGEDQNNEKAEEPEKNSLRLGVSAVQTSYAQRVLYFDFELSRQQFEARYCFDPGPGDKSVGGPHQFSPNFLWSEIDPCVAAPKDCRRFEDFVLDAIESEIKRTGAKVVIIDNIDRFNGEIMRARDIAYVMSRLKRLKATLDLSILVLAHLPRRNPKMPLAVDRLMATRTLCAFADNVFAIGQSRWDERCRYLKHLKTRSTDIVYDAEYVPTFLVFKDEGQFLSFNFEGFRREEILLDPYLNKTRLDRSDRVKELAAAGMNQRDIAHHLDMSLGSVNRAMNMWSPFDDRPKPPPTEFRRRRPAKTAKTVEQTSKNGGSAISVEPVSASRGSATRGYLDSLGVDMSVSPSVSSVPSVVNGFSTTEYTENTDRFHGKGLIEASGLKLSFDGYGREIFIEKERERDGKPMIWYRVGKEGEIHRSERIFDGYIRNSIVDKIGSSTEVKR